MTLTLAQIATMDAQTINDRWSEVTAADQAEPPVPELWRDPDALQPLTFDDIRRMSEIDIDSNWDRIQTVLQKELT